jgi:hypothetical protein
MKSLEERLLDRMRDRLRADYARCYREGYAEGMLHTLVILGIAAALGAGIRILLP